MLGSLITFPLRVGLRVTELTLRGTAEVLRRAAGLTGGSDHDGHRPVADPRSAPPEPARRPAVAEQPTPAVPDPEVQAFTVDYDAPTPVEPAHVSEDAELVEEVADPGAEDGAGAEVHIAEPWDGYRQLRAADVVNRLGGASTAELAAIELYEQAGRRRRTVIAAAQRELKRRG